MKKLIVNADDFGYNSKINQGIINAYKNGVVTSASLMVTKDGFEDAINLAKENPRISIGLHLELDSFFDIDHMSGKIIGLKSDLNDRSRVENEIRMQIEKMKSFGILPDHVTGHHHVHLVKEVFYPLISLMKEYNIYAIRFNKKIVYDQADYEEFKNYLDDQQIIYPPHFIEGWYWGNIDEPYTVGELMTHPGYGELWREYELLASCDAKLKIYLREKNIKLISYADLIDEFKLKSN